MAEKLFRLRLETRDQRRRVYWLGQDGQLTQTISYAAILANPEAERQLEILKRIWCRSNLNPPSVKLVPA